METTAFVSDPPASELTSPSSSVSLRPIRSDDVSDRYLSWLNNPSVNSMLESRFTPITKESLLEYVEQVIADPQQRMFAIIDRQSSLHIGNIKLGPINYTHGLAEIGILIGEISFWGKGKAAEAITLLSSYAFSTLQLRKLTAGCYSNNHGSIRAFQRAGFSIEGVRPSHFFHEGHYVDYVLLGRLRDNPKPDACSRDSKD